MAEPAYRIEYTGHWPRPCRGCGERMWRPHRWAHRRCALTLSQRPHCGAIGPNVIAGAPLVCKLKRHDTGWHVDESGARWTGFDRESADGIL